MRGTRVLRSMLQIEKLDAKSTVGFTVAGREAFDEGGLNASEEQQNVATALAHGTNTPHDISREIFEDTHDVIKELKKLEAKGFVRHKNFKD